MDILFARGREFDLSSSDRNLTTKISILFNY